MIRIVRPPLKALALGLDLVLVRFAYLLLTWCLHVPLKYIGGAYNLARPRHNRIYRVVAAM